jgi:hypothetical protein
MVYYSYTVGYTGNQAWEFMEDHESPAFGFGCLSNAKPAVRRCLRRLLVMPTINDNTGAATDVKKETKS